MVTIPSRLPLLLSALACFFFACATSPSPEAPPNSSTQEHTTDTPEPPGPHPESGLPRRKISIAGEVFTFEIADEFPERARGLSGRKNLPRNDGMLFAYKKPEILGYWMKDCFIDIDIVYVRSDVRIVSTYSMKKEPPRGENEPLYEYEGRLPRYSSRHLVQFALEFAPGTIKRLGLKPGQVIQLPRKELLEHAE